MSKHPTVPRNRMLVRVLTMLALLRTRRMSIDQLARTLGVSTRTVRRYLTALEAANVPLMQMSPREDATRPWHLMPGWLQAERAEEGGAR